tara:strand:+ start:244 stop:471 length:228 start_codon:yes stop_codon:yes gene_type:complete
MDTIKYKTNHLDKDYTLTIIGGGGVNGHYTGWIHEIKKVVGIRFNKHSKNQIQVSEKAILGYSTIKYNRLTFIKC